MKRVTILLIALSTLLFTGCKERGERTLPGITGAPNGILIVSSEKIWQGPIADTVKGFFEREMVVLPQDEKEFSLTHIPPEKFERHFGKYRNVIQLSINSSLDSAEILYQENLKSRTQQYFLLQAPDMESLVELFAENCEMIRSTILRVENERFISAHRRFPAQKVVDHIRDSLNLRIAVPGGFNLNLHHKDFVWTSEEKTEYSLGVIIFIDTLEDLIELTPQRAMDRVNELLEENIPGPIENTWMELDMEVPFVSELIVLHDKYYTTQIRGLWDVENDFMAGPYVLNIIYDEESNRVIYAMAYVYYPIEKKRDKVRKVEAIINSIVPINKR